MTSDHIEILMSIRTHTKGDPGYTVTMPCLAVHAAAARHFVRFVVGAWGLDDLADDSALLVTELMANAVEHTASGLVRVSITLPGKQRVRIIVTERSRNPPVLRKAEAHDEHGRGLALLDSVTQR
jgi:hypothetical protein